MNLLLSCLRQNFVDVIVFCFYLMHHQTLVDSMKSGTLGRWGNQIGYVLLPLAMGFRSNPLDYVKEAKAVIDQKKVSLEPLFTYFVVELVLKLFGIKAVGKLNHRVFFNTTLWFSNVPGPQQEVTFYGHDATYIAPSCYGQPNVSIYNMGKDPLKSGFYLSSLRRIVMMTCGTPNK
ncbi:putative O-acyltransferase WSD1 [Helianthus anomalus]